MNITNVLPELIKIRDDVQNTIEKCQEYIESEKNTEDPIKQAEIDETIKSLESLEQSLEKLDEKINRIRSLH